MLTRRHILRGTAAAVCFGGIGVGPAVALSLEPMPDADANAISLACARAGSHANLLADMRLLLDDEVTAGLRPANYVEAITCPICHCSLQVSSDAAF